MRQSIQSQIQLMSKTRPDQFPNYTTAGYKKEVGEESTSTCLQPPLRDIRTPEEIAKYRKSFKEQTGVSIPHYGLADLKRKGDSTYGMPTEKSEKISEIMQAGELNRVQQFVTGIQESKYDSFKREPLGKPLDRQYNMPGACQQSGFCYGLPTENSIYGAKETIYSGQNMLEEEQVRQMYLKSHKNYDPGEQKQRQYEWPVDPADFRFGQVEKNAVHNELKQILTPQAHSEAFPKTSFVKVNQNDFVDRKNDKLGRSMNIGQKIFPPDKVFGVRIEPNEWDAGKCLKGEANEYQVRPDDDLGRSIKPGCRNISKEGDENRSFGVPTIRYDIKKPDNPSVADPNNYADETTAVELLFPKRFAAYGIEQADFEKTIEKQEIRVIFENIGFKLKSNIFEAVFARAKAIQGTILDRVSCKSFRASLLQMCA